MRVIFLSVYLPVYHQEKSFMKFVSLRQLSGTGDALASTLMKSTSKLSKHIDYQIKLLEVLTYEIKRYDRAGYCDYELAYMCYYIIKVLLKECKKHDSPANDLIPIIEQTLEKKLMKIDLIMHVINLNSIEEDLDSDPLLSRFNKLNNATSSKVAIDTTKSPILDDFQYTESITAPQLHSLINDKVSILLIDFRTKTEYSYNHINNPNVINIEPAIVANLLGSENKNNAHMITDQDLEERLSMLLPEEQFDKFMNRQKYELIVIYNLKYGVKQKEVNRFEALISLLIKDEADGNPSKNPFTNLIELLAYRNKYISTKLKRSPCYLNGGVSFWYDLYGEDSIAKTAFETTVSLPPASLSRNATRSYSNISTSNNNKSSTKKSISPSESPYLKNFGDYLGTAKTTSQTPVSNSFLRPAQTQQQPSNYVGASHKIDPWKLNETPSSPLQYAPPQQQQPPRRPSISSKILGSLVNATKSSNNKSSSPSSSSLGVAEKKDPTKFLDQYATGLTNLGNSCYMNCILQCLGATPQLTKFFIPSFPETSPNGQTWRKHINSANKMGTKGLVTINFVSLLLNMFANNGSSFSPSSFKKIIGTFSPGQQFNNFDQQDCIEFLTFLLDAIHEDLNQMGVATAQEKQQVMELTPEQEKTREVLPIRLASTIEWERYLKLNFSIIVDYFQGQYLSQLRCLECGNTSTTYNAFLILSLPLPEKLGSSSTLTLDDCLKEFVELELLDDENKWHCPKCKNFTRLTKKITITRLPQVLIIHFKRFKISPTGHFSKMENLIKYPVNEVLDLTSYWPPVGSSVNPNIDPADIMTPEKEAEILSTLPTRNQVPPFRYKLYAVANHFGNLTTGHYTAYVHKQSDKKKVREWCYFDDAKVTFNQKENQVVNKNAYCLFYQRI